MSFFSSVLLLTILLLQLSVTSATKIIIPSAHVTYVPGETVTIKVGKNSLNPSSQTIAFSVGLSVYNQSLGRPYINSIYTARPGAWKWNAQDFTYSFDVQIPAAKDFIDGYDRPYTLAISEFYLEGENHVPKIGFSNTPVSIRH